MKSKITILSLLLTGIFWGNKANAQWQPEGAVALSAGQVAYTSVAVDQSGIPYIAYEDLANNEAVTVKKFTAGSWVTLGTAGFSGGPSTYISLAIDSASGTPYVAFQDSLNNVSVTVMKYTGSSWSVVDAVGFTGAQADYISLAVGSDGNPMVAFKDDGNNDFKATVMKFNGSHFVNVGSAGFSAGGVDYVSLAIDRSTGTPYVAYEDEAADNDQVTVNKFNGNNWVAVGATGFSTSAVAYVSLAIDKLGTPYVVFSDFSTSTNGASVLKFNGSSWVYVGPQGFTTGEADYTNIAISPSGVPCIVYSDNINADRATVASFNGTAWVNVGNADFSSSEADYNSIAIAPNGTVFVGYDDYGDSHTATVMKFVVPNGITEESFITSIEIYPNPSRGDFQLKLQATQAGEVQLSLFDVTGKLMWQDNPVMVNGNFTGTISADGLAKGIYMLRIKTSTGMENRKLEVE
jgi:hypothetical protein